MPFLVNNFIRRYYSFVMMLFGQSLDASFRSVTSRLLTLDMSWLKHDCCLTSCSLRPQLCLFYSAVSVHQISFLLGRWLGFVHALGIERSEHQRCACLGENFLNAASFHSVRDLPFTCECSILMSVIQCDWILMTSSITNTGDEDPVFESTLLHHETSVANCTRAKWVFYSIEERGHNE